MAASQIQRITFHKIKGWLIFSHALSRRIPDSGILFNYNIYGAVALIILPEFLKMITFMDKLKAEL
jgi:hypothetical protein